MADRSKTARVVIVGGGFAGLYAASYLSRSELAESGVSITLLDPKNYFTFTPLLAEVAGGTLGREHVTYPYRELAVECGFDFVHRPAMSLDTNRRVVVCEHRELPYDYLLVATGARPQFFGNENIAKLSVPFTTVEDALRVRSRLIDSLERAEFAEGDVERRRLLTFVVAGGGPAGIEIASEINNLLTRELPPYYPNVTDARVVVAVAGERILAGFDEALADEGLDVLRERQVEIRLGTMVADYDGRCVTLENDKGSERIETNTLIWTAGTTPGDWLAQQGLATERGALRTDEYLRIEGRDVEFAAGDASYRVDPRSQHPYPKVAPIAISQGIRAAANIENVAKGRPLEPYQAHHAGKIVSLGAGHALVEILGVKLKGRLAWWTYRTAYLLKLVGLRNKVRVAFTLMIKRVFGPDIGYEEDRAGEAPVTRP